MTKTVLKSPRNAYRLDHLVLPAADIEAVRSRLVSLGFIVAPKGEHPFGTVNACVYFKDGTFLEPLSIGHRETAEAAALSGNQFVARDAAYRFRRGQDGFSALVAATEDAAADSERFKAAGFSAGDNLDFGRDFVTSSGDVSRMNFRLAFAADLRSPDFFGFTCQRINVPKADRSALIGHENGVTRIKTVVLTEANPTDFQYLLQELFNEREVDAHSFGMDIHVPNATISVLTPEGFEAFYGQQAHSCGRGLRARAVVFGVTDVAKTRAVLEASSLPYETHLNRIIVKPASGQGALFAFEAE